MGREGPSSGSDALGEAYDRCGGRVYAYVLSMVGSRETAEDVVQEAFCRLAARGAPFGGAQGLRLFGVRDVDAYLFRVARNEALRWISRRPRREAPAEGAPEPAAPGPDPSERDRRDVVRAALARLPPDQAEVVHLKVYEGMTFDQIAEFTGTSPNTAASRWRYACEKLRQSLKDDSHD